MFSGDLQTAREKYKKSIELATTDWSWFLREYYLTVSYIFENDYMGAIDNVNKVENNLVKREIDDLTHIQMKSWLSLHKLICYAHNQMEEEAYNALKNKISLDKEKTKSVINFLETLEDDDDVQGLMMMMMMIKDGDDDE